MMEDDRITKLEEELDRAKEDLFNTQTDLDFLKAENTALKEFLINLYDSCKELEEVEIEASQLIQNLTTNILRFAKDHNIRF